MARDFRSISLRILNDVFISRRWAKESIEANLKDIDEEHRDLKKIYELVYGVLRNKNYIDFYLGLYIPKPVSDPVVQNILRMGYYQLMHMDSIPPYAAIDVCVELTKELVHPKPAGFVNAVLRNILREKGRGVRIPDADKTQFYSIKYSYEPWMVKFFVKHYGAEAAERIMAAGNGKPPVFLRVNTIKNTAEEASETLKAQGVETEKVKGFKNALSVVKGDAVRTQAFESGLIYVQDLSPQAASGFVEASKDDAIVDIGSAPGGKAASFAMDMKDKGSIVAIEPNEARLKVMERNFVRLGITNTQFIKHDATADIEAFHGRADKVVVDAPCSALGVIRRHPEKKWCLTEAELKEFPKLQMKILETVKEWVKKGGELYYMTCTLNPDENEKVVEKFLEKNGDFKEAAMVPDETKWKDFRDGRCMKVLPGNAVNSDGFFAVKLKRK